MQPEADAWTIAPTLDAPLGHRARETWRYRRILYFFAGRSLAVLYRNTKLGPLWLVIRQVMPVLVGSVVFGRFMGEQDSTSYTLFLMAGSAVWGLFSNPLARGARGIEYNRTLLTKLYLPRLILVAAQMTAGLVEGLFLLLMLFATLGYYWWTTGAWSGSTPPPLGTAVPAAVVSVVVAMAMAFAMAVWAAPMVARARDMRYALNYVLSLWSFITPVAYPLSKIPPQLRWIAAVNPMSGPVETFRWAVLGTGEPAWRQMGISAVFVVVLLVTGLRYFARVESATVDSL